MASDATSAFITSGNPGTTPTPERTTGGASAASTTFLGVSRADSSQVVVQIQTYGAVISGPTVSNGVVQITVPDGSGTPGTTNYLVVQQSRGISENWSFDLQVSTRSGNGGGTITFAKGVGTEQKTTAKEMAE
jgi:hypothetical protein